MHKKSKHINTKLDFIRERVENGEVEIQYIPTDDMTAHITVIVIIKVHLNTIQAPRLFKRAVN